MYKLSLILGVSLGLLSPLTARGDAVTTPRSLGMGGALRAAPTGAASIFLNPAGMPLIKAYMVQGFYDFHVRENGHVAHTSIVDSQASKWVAAALYYNLRIFRPKVFERSLQREITLKKDSHEAGLSVAVPLGQRFSLGATLRYLYLKTEAEAQVIEEGEAKTVKLVRDKINTVGVDVGALVMITEGLTVGVTGMNLVPQNSPDFPISLGFGVAYAYKTRFTVAADILLDFTSRKKVTMNYFGGAELFLAGKFAIRAGARHLGFTKNTQVTAGFGYINPKVGLDVFLAQQVDGGQETQIGFGVRTFFGAQGRRGR